MSDPRITQLAELLIDHSCGLKSGQKLLIEAFDLPTPELVCRLVETASQRGAIPVVSLKSNAVLRSQYQHATEAVMTLQGELESHTMSQMDAYIGVRGAANSNDGCFSREYELVSEALVEAGACGNSRPANPLGRAAISNGLDGAGCQHEHLGVRKLFFRCLYRRLCPNGRESETTHGADERDERCPDHVSGDRSFFLD